MLPAITVQLQAERNCVLTSLYRQKQARNFSKQFSSRAFERKHVQTVRCFRLPEKTLQLKNTICRNASTYLKKNYSESVIEDATLDFTGMARKYNYPVEEHTVHTSDGYVLQLHRLAQPHGKPVFLMHGLLDSSDTWIIQGPKAGLGYYLHDQGYDVWLGNARGNFYSRNHFEKCPKKSAFWDFSWHEIGCNDLPAMIDYVLEKTAHKQLAYFGHSQGTTVFFVMASMRPEYNSKVWLMSALAPVAYMSQMKTPMEAFIRSLAFLREDSAFEILPRNNSWKFLFSTKTTESWFVKFMYDYLGGHDGMWNPARLPAIAAHSSSGASIKQLRHYFQLKDSMNFCQYDYGKERNIERYGSAEPPLYPLEKITAPIALYYAQNDPLSAIADVRTLIAELPNVFKDHMFPDKQWGHVSMLWGDCARNLAHKHMVEILRKCE
ncbi:lipase 3-like isoform X2 [Rhagoletis pomonella]|nr:lipase 3-like isoform X2 [Rhagoletis pomonella]XP_036329177.1 lipase 3-like isoform X2 [Rhagoletis pomonella]